MIPTDIKKPLRINREGAETTVHSAPLIFAFRQELAPDAPLAGCCGFAGPFPPPLSISRFYAARIRKNTPDVNKICLMNMLNRPDSRASNYLENRVGICYKKESRNPALHAVCKEAT
jgi:hypothetical protein